MKDAEARSDWVFGLSLVQVILLLFFAATLIYVTQNVDVSGQEPPSGSGETNHQDISVQARLDAATKKNNALEQELGDMSGLVDELKFMVGAKVSSKEGFREAIETLKRGYALCQKDDNTLIEATIRQGAENVQVIGEIPSDLFVNLAKGDSTSDLDQIVSFIQDVYE
ncbi:MAG TPA: hypothetical protein VFR82_06590, partial [Nitrospira sp.]|nr:hypothetical protein [Nitrospira sp.]